MHPRKCLTNILPRFEALHQLNHLQVWNIDFWVLRKIIILLCIAYSLCGFKANLIQLTRIAVPHYFINFSFNRIKFLCKPNHDPSLDIASFSGIFSATNNIWAFSLYIVNRQNNHIEPNRSIYNMVKVSSNRTWKAWDQKNHLIMHIMILH